MGNFISAQRAAARARARSDRIDREIEEERVNFPRKYDILILGPRKSGKSTILKQLELSDKGSFSKDELVSFRPAVYKNTLESARMLVKYMHKNGLKCSNKENDMHCDQIIDYRLDDSSRSAQDLRFSPEIANAIHQVRKDPIVSRILTEHSGKLSLPDNAEYFFKKVLDIGLPEYLPNDADVLWAYKENTGLSEINLTNEQSSICITEVGSNRNGERRKWIHHFENVISLIFCVDLGSYDQVVSGDNSQNRLLEAFTLLEIIINSRWFLHSSIILYLNKIDVFKAKLNKSPLEQYFPEYSGGNDVDRATKYILWRLMQTNRARLNVYTHVMQATDMPSGAQQKQMLFSAVKEGILRNTLRDEGVL